MSTPDEYVTWQCEFPEETHPGRDCSAIFVGCDDCDGTGKVDGIDCDGCSGAGGGHQCLHEDQ